MPTGPPPRAGTQARWPRSLADRRLKRALTIQQRTLNAGRSRPFLIARKSSAFLERAHSTVGSNANARSRGGRSLADAMPASALTRSPNVCARRFVHRKLHHSSRYWKRAPAWKFP
jgi:hypothetical protein